MRSIYWCSYSGTVVEIAGDAFLLNKLTSLKYPQSRGPGAFECNTLTRVSIFAIEITIGNGAFE